MKNKEIQFELIQRSNPMTDNYHVGIRSLSDIKSAREVFKENDFIGSPDWNYEDAQKALDSCKITVYSSKPIVQGGFVSPSQMMAQDYAGDGKVYSKEVSIDDVAWIDSIEGQFAKG